MTRENRVIVVRQDGILSNLPGIRGSQPHHGWSGDWSFIRWTVQARIHVSNLVISLLIYVPQQASGPSDLTSRADALRVYFLDVGQGDSAQVQLPSGQNLLVDAVINNFAIGEVYMPKATNNTQTFRDLLTAVKSKGLQVKTAKAGATILENGNLSVRMLAPVGTGYEDMNNYSAVIKIKYGSVTFLLTGDAEGISEKEMLESGADVKAQGLKVGHHGSNSSTTMAFLKAVGPQYAVISVGEGNDYHHPHLSTLDKLKKAGVNVCSGPTSGGRLCMRPTGRRLPILR